MHKNIPPAITSLSLGHIRKLLKAYVASRVDSQSPGTWQLSTRLAGRVGHETQNEWWFLTGFLVTLTLAGCASAPPERVLSTKVPTYASLPNGYNPMNPDQVSPMYDRGGVRG